MHMVLCCRDLVCQMSVSKLERKRVRVCFVLSWFFSTKLM